MKNKLPLALFILVLVMFQASSAHANGLSLSVTPTIFEVAAVPGQSFTTTVKVINSNDYEITVYAEAQNFMPRGERGHSNFIPIASENSLGQTLGEWMDIAPTPYVIAAGKTVPIPVTINIPKDAPPGGHYAAVMIGTRPPAGSGEPEVRTAQVISSLFFMRIAGDVIEKGTVRTFRSATQFTQTPEMSFSVRFQNDGNVHLQPRGEIVITNMWGKERGKIPINQTTNFGNVLPDSVREYEYSWKGEQSFTDFGLYKARLSLAYGLESKKFSSQSTSFWVVPIKPFLTLLGIIVFVVWFGTKMIKAYVRRMLLLSGIDPDAPKTNRYSGKRVSLVGDVQVPQKVVSYDMPVRAGFVDLRQRLMPSLSLFLKIKTLFRFIYDYRWFFLSSLVVLILISALYIYITGATTELRDYEVVIQNESQPVTISSEEIISNEQAAPARITDDLEKESRDQAYTITIVNSSDTPGLAASFKTVLEAAGYTVDSLESDLESSRAVSAIIYDPALNDAALALSALADNALLSPFATERTDGELPQITIYLGNDYQAQ